MKCVNDMTRKEFDKLPYRGAWDKQVICTSIVLLPTRRKHDSGYRVMDFVAVRKGRPVCRLSECSDVVHLGGIGGSGSLAYNSSISPIPWSIDCLPKSGLFHMWANGYELVCGSALSSFCLYVRKM